MKRSLILFLLLICNTMTTFGQQPATIEAFIEKWDNSSAYLLEMVESIPEDALDYKPTDRQMSVQEQLLHIRANMLWLGNSYFNQQQAEMPDAKITPENKIALKSALEEAFLSVRALVSTTTEAELKEQVEFFAGPKNKLQILNLLQDHVTHHRGQLIVYMNLLNLEPPRYSGW